MGEELFLRLKKLAKREGKIVFADNDDAFVILPLDEYEGLTEDLCGEECECGADHEFGEEIFMDDDKHDEEDKDLIKRVNEDIAKWREERMAEERKKSSEQAVKQEEKTEEFKDFGETAADETEKNDVLTEEERYYLEPLE